MSRILSAFMLCIGIAPWATPLESFTEPGAAPVAHTDEPFVYERLTSSYHFEADGTGRVVSEQRIRIQNDIAVQQIGQLFFPYVAGRSRLEVEHLRVRKRDGSVTDVSPDLLQDLPAPVTALFPVYSDARILHATVPAFRPGDTVELRLVNHLEEPDAPDRFWVVHYFESNAIVLEEVLEVDLPAGEPIHLRVADGLEGKTVETEGRKTYRWTHSNRTHSGTMLEDWTSVAATEPDVELSNFRDWQEVGAWYRTLEGDRVVANAAIRRKTKELVEGLENDASKIEAIYRYVARELRYLGLFFGASRYQPHPAAEVFANGYGDCKDKHTLLAALLSAAGYQSVPVLIGSFSELTVDVPSPQMIDHEITAVSLGEELLFMDSTNVAPFGYLAPELRGKTALLIPIGGEARLVETPENLPYPSRRSFTLEGEADDAGRLSARIELRYRGDDEYILRLAFLTAPAASWKELVQLMNQATGFSGEVENLEIADLTAIEEPLNITYTLSQAGYLQAYSKEQNVDLLLPPDQLPTVPQPVEGKAAESLQLGFPTVSSNRFAITLPERFDASAPVPVTLDRDFASYRSSFRIDGRVLRVEEEIAIKQPEIAPDRFQEYEAFRKTVAKARKQTFLLRSPGADEAMAKASDVGALFEAASQAADDGDHATAAALYSRVVEIEPKHETAWLELGRALVNSGEAEKGAEAIRRQIEINPFNERGYTNLGWALEKTGDLPGAEAAYRSHLEQHPLDHYANRHLGELLKRQNRCDEAVTFLRNALSIKSDDHASRTRLGACQLDLGQNAEGLAILKPLVEHATEGWMLSSAGDAALQHDELDAAIMFFTRATELDAEDELSLEKLAEAHYRKSHTGKAIEILRRLTREIAPESPRAHSLLGMMLFGVGRFEEAEAASQNALAMDSEDPSANHVLGMILARQERYVEALPHLEKARAGRPADFPDQDVLDYVRKQVNVAAD